MKWSCSLNLHLVNYRVVKIVHISTEKVTNLVINQPYFPFKCDVNILGKCIIKLPNLQQIMVFSRHSRYFKLSKTDVNQPETNKKKTVCSDKNMKITLSVHAAGYRVVKTYVWILFSPKVFFFHDVITN